MDPTLFARIAPAQDAASWTDAGVESAWAPWIAWNIREERWFGSAELLDIERALSAKDSSLGGPALLCACAGELKNKRAMSEEEKQSLPSSGFTHLRCQDYSPRFELEASSAWAKGGSAGELNPTEVPEGVRISVRPSRRMPVIWRWVTFEAGGLSLSPKPDDPLRYCGLPWISKDTTLLRAEIPLETLRNKGAAFAIPTVFDGLDTNISRCSPDWRARPIHEHHEKQPWGLARDIVLDGAGWPEILVDISKAGPMILESLGKTTQDFSMRPYLSQGGPK